MKLYKNQSGIAHHALLFIAMFGILGMVMFRVSNADSNVKKYNVTGKANICVKASKSSKCSRTAYPNVRVSAVLKSNPPTSDNTGGVSLAFAADKNGNFKIPSVSPGTYVVTPQVITSQRPTVCPAKTVTITAKSKKLDITCTTPDAAAIGMASGRVSLKTFEDCGKQTAPCKLAYTAALVTLYPKGSSTPAAQVVADKKGEFRVAMKPGSYTVHGTLFPPTADNDYLSCTQPTLTIKAKKSSSVSIACDSKKPGAPAPTPKPAPPATSEKIKTVGFAYVEDNPEFCRNENTKSSEKLRCDLYTDATIRAVSQTTGKVFTTNSDNIGQYIFMLEPGVYSIFAEDRAGTINNDSIKCENPKTSSNIFTIVEKRYPPNRVAHIVCLYIK